MDRFHVVVTLRSHYTDRAVDAAVLIDRTIIGLTDRVLDWIYNPIDHGPGYLVLSHQYHDHSAQIDQFVNRELIGEILARLNFYQQIQQDAELLVEVPSNSILSNLGQIEDYY